MGYTKTIVCLADSRKNAGRCIAGKEYIGSSWCRWIRPVSKRATEEISDDECRYEDRTRPDLLDIVSVPFIEPRPRNYQTENHLIDDKCNWSRKGRIPKGSMSHLLDSVNGPIWINYDSSHNGMNDRINTPDANKLGNSLLLINPEDPTIIVQNEGTEFSNPVRKVRAKFSLNKIQYCLVVTDPRIEKAFQAKKDGHYPLHRGGVYMCISLGEPWKGYCYKLVASIISKI